MDQRTVHGRHHGGHRLCPGDGAGLGGHHAGAHDDRVRMDRQQHARVGHRHRGAQELGRRAPAHRRGQALAVDGEKITVTSVHMPTSWHDSEAWQSAMEDVAVGYRKVRDKFDLLCVITAGGWNLDIQRRNEDARHVVYDECLQKIKMDNIGRRGGEDMMWTQRWRHPSGAETKREPDAPAAATTSPCRSRATARSGPMLLQGARVHMRDTGAEEGGGHEVDKGHGWRDDGVSIQEAMQIVVVNIQPPDKKGSWRHSDVHERAEAALAKRTRCLEAAATAIEPGAAVKLRRAAWWAAKKAARHRARACLRDAAEGGGGKAFRAGRSGRVVGVLLGARSPPPLPPLRTDGNGPRQVVRR